MIVDDLTHISWYRRYIRLSLELRHLEKQETEQFSLEHQQQVQTTYPNLTADFKIDGLFTWVCVSTFCSDLKATGLIVYPDNLHIDGVYIYVY